MEDLDITRNLNFDNTGDPTRPPPGATAAPGGQPHVGGRANGPPPQRPPNQERPAPPELEVDHVTNLPLYSTPMDNVLAMQAAVSNLDPAGEHADQINYAKALVNKAVEQQVAASDSRGRIYSRTSSSRAASSAARRAAEGTVANRQNFPLPEPQLQLAAPAYSTNKPHPIRRAVAANGEPIDARQHIDNVQQWRAQQPHELRHSLDQNRQARDSYNSHPPTERNNNRGADPQQARNDDPGFGREVGSLHTFIGLDNRREKKFLTRAVSVNAVTTDTTRYLNWSEQPIGWSREDHPRRVEYPGWCALTVRPKVGDYWLAKTLMDGGSTINIMYLDTFN